jgi:pyrroloquinoline quinone biosynthesis protein D
VSGGANDVTIGVDAAARPVLGRRFRLQWEPAQNAHVLLYPEGMIKLNGSAAEILKRCDGEATIAAITADLERAFGASNLAGDVVAFVNMAAAKNWLSFAP